MPRDRSPWLRLGLSLVGVAISAYLTLVHYDHHVSLTCPLHGGLVNCEAVVTSASSVVLGLPIALWGVLWFVVAGVLAGWPLVAGATTAGARTVTMVWSVIGILSVLYFLYLELHVDGHLCIWCTMIHALVLAYLASIALSPPAPDAFQ